MSKELAKLSANALRALAMVKDLEGDTTHGVTAAQMKSEGFEDLNPAHLTALVKRDYVVATEVKLVCNCCGAKRKVNAYKTTALGREFKGA